MGHLLVSASLSVVIGDEIKKCDVQLYHEQVWRPCIIMSCLQQMSMWVDMVPNFIFYVIDSLLAIHMHMRRTNSQLAGQMSEITQS